MTARISALLLLAMGLSACAEKSTVWDNNQGTRQNTVELLRVPYDVQFAGDMTALTTQETARLDQFLATVKPGTHDVITIDAADSATRLASLRSDSLRSHLTKAGYKVAAGLTPGGESPAANSLRLMVERAVVRGPKCPDWSRKAAPNYANAPTSNLGCATESALGLMVANPRDLVSPETYEPANSESAAQAVQRLRTDKVKWTDTKSATTDK
ncbi:CpaD family pilus assembly lipoprotein [Govanella unica]|uniref:CpaD family pilus assembly protein n=1 Tax=Govanella unica TaxID=2975056 RepID=A0A9X3U034_9PROT|nr:CpaD family pilus assembly lipoprotein [Govania unica]MDA5194969.1 CpaD family pilus assembly protein [Govania unica]